MICDDCKMGADVAADYRADDREWNEKRGAKIEGVRPSGRLLIRLRRALHLHCRNGGTRCDCQCKIPELKGDRQAEELLSRGK